METKKGHIATKSEELEALGKIREIVEALGENSYIGTAFEGCFEIAEENIENDFAVSMKQKRDALEKYCDDFRKLAEASAKELDKCQMELRKVREQLDRELEWKDYEIKENVPQSEYDKLEKQAETKCLNEREVKDLLYDWFGFAKEKVRIVTSVPVYQVNRHGCLRKVGSSCRHPLYFATDWNYIRFDCGQMCYELSNGEISLFLH